MTIFNEIQQGNLERVRELIAENPRIVHAKDDKVYETLDSLEDEVCKFIQNNLTKDVVTNICNSKVTSGQL